MAWLTRFALIKRDSQHSQDPSRNLFLTRRRDDGKIHFDGSLLDESRGQKWPFCVVNFPVVSYSRTLVWPASTSWTGWLLASKRWNPICLLPGILPDIRSYSITWWNWPELLVLRLKPCRIESPWSISRIVGRFRTTLEACMPAVWPWPPKVQPVSDVCAFYIARRVLVRFH